LFDVHVIAVLPAGLTSSSSDLVISGLGLA
jgi:hypothetical protein